LRCHITPRLSLFFMSGTREWPMTRLLFRAFWYVTSERRAPKAAAEDNA
jgi:hypothetical protein